MYFVAFKDSVPVQVSQSLDEVADLLLTTTADTIKSFETLELMISFLSSNEKQKEKTAHQNVEGWLEDFTLKTEEFTNNLCDKTEEFFSSKQIIKEITDFYKEQFPIWKKTISEIKKGKI
jgi:hypothetical protein